MSSAPSAYPLAWPEGWPRTKTPGRSRFDISFTKARTELGWEIERMGGHYPVLSSNLPLRIDGQPRSMDREPDDPGVAVYFERAGKQMVFACDRWDRTRDNIRAIGKTIEALRGIERWGASDMMERALRAFMALPPPFAWWEVLGLPRNAPVRDIEAAHRRMAKLWHPDRVNGSAARMAEVNAARDAGLAERAAP